MYLEKIFETSVHSSWKNKCTTYTWNIFKPPSIRQRFKHPVGTALKVKDSKWILTDKKTTVSQKSELWARAIVTHYTDVLNYMFDGVVACDALSVGTGMSKKNECPHGSMSCP